MGVPQGSVLGHYCFSCMSLIFIKLFLMLKSNYLLMIQINFYMIKMFALYLIELILVYSICLNSSLPTGLALMLTKRVFVFLVMREKSS